MITLSADATASAVCEHGIIDPAKVERCALQNAASIAGMFLTTEALVLEAPEEKRGPMMPAGADMDY